MMRSEEVSSEGLGIAVVQKSEESFAVESEGEVYVTRTSKKYHREGCTSLSRSKIPISLTDAKERYSPCGRCNPSW